MEILKALNMDFIPLIVGAIVGLFKTFKFVKEGERGVKLRFGKVVRNRQGKPKVIEPGFVVLIPFAESLIKHHVRQQTLSLEDQRIMTKDQLIFIIGAMVNFKVTDIYKALFEIDNLDESLVDLSRAVLREVLTKKEWKELSDMEKISEELLEELKEKADEWGVEFVQFKLTDCDPTAESSHIVTAETGVKVKLGALKNALKGSNLPLDGLPAQLVSVLVGNPLVTSIGSEKFPLNRNLVDNSPERSWLSKLLDDEKEEKND